MPNLERPLSAEAPNADQVASESKSFVSRWRRKMTSKRNEDDREIGDRFDDYPYQDGDCPNGECESKKKKTMVKIQKVYIPKPYPVIHRVKVIQKVPVIRYKVKIKKIPVIKKKVIIKKIKVPIKIKVPVIKKIKVPVYKKISVPIIRKVVKYVPKTNKVSHVHVHKVYVTKGKKKKKKKKGKFFKKFKAKMKKKMMKKKMKKVIKYLDDNHCDGGSYGGQGDFFKRSGFFGRRSDALDCDSDEDKEEDDVQVGE
ncbi:hypothetical protein HDE_09829 [Halotydeus destructor]|nr:hypothetical protein HDE_09829 [Halotydeus destructor]